jgi:3-hydroxybutyryl-CoA dehydrogenase
MLFAAIRNGARRQAPMAARSFSTTTNKLAAAEVRKLGVIGAGQMVSCLMMGCHTNGLSDG